MSNKNHEITRRVFIRQSACAALELTGVVNTLGLMKLTNAAVIQGNLAPTNDYRALVCLFLAGGNDANNMLVPMGTTNESPLRADYEDARGHISLPSSSLHPINIPTTTNAFKKHHGSGVYSMGIHPNAQPLTTLYNEKDLAFVCNVGSLVYPILGRQSYLQELVDAPPNLFSHNSQSMQWQTSIADQKGQTGWGGRMADLLSAGYNGDASKASMSLSMSGLSVFQRGTTSNSAAFTIDSEGAKPLSNFGTNYSRAYQDGSTFDNPIYKNNSYGHRLKALEDIWRLSNENLLQTAYANRFVSSRTVEGVIANALDYAENSTTIDFDTAFANSDTDLGNNLKTVAKIIAGRSSLGNRRQIFFVKVGGYDTHSSILESHALLMDELSNALLSFRTALQQIGDWDKVVTFTGSDFGRTLSPNTTGTDHAWGGHAIVMGGPINGGDLYGHYPSLKLGDHPDSWDAKSRGLLIPTTSVDQYSAPLAKWFGADSSSMETIFPNLTRFDDPFTSSTANLQFI